MLLMCPCQRVVSTTRQQRTRHERRDATDLVNRDPESKSTSELKGNRHDWRVLSHVGEACGDSSALSRPMSSSALRLCISASLR